MNNRETKYADHQILAIRAARARSASASARQTSSVGASPGRAAGREAFLAATGAASGLRIFTPSGSGRNNKGPGLPEAFECSSVVVAYFSELLIEVNLVFRLEPRPLTTAMIASEIPAAIRPYSIAVAPDSSFTKRAIRFFIGNSMCTRGCVELTFGLAG